MKRRAAAQQMVEVAMETYFQTIALDSGKPASMPWFLFLQAGFFVELFGEPYDISIRPTSYEEIAETKAELEEILRTLEGDDADPS